MTLPIPPHAAGGGAGPSPLPLQSTFAVSSSTIVQALNGVPITGDANLWQNVDTEVTSDYNETPNVTGARGGGFRFGQWANTLADHVAGVRVMKIQIRDRVTGGTIDTRLQLFYNGSEENDPDWYNYTMTHAAVATWYTATFTISLARVQTLDIFDQDQYFEFWKPATAAARSARFGWAKIYEEFT